MGLFNLLLGLVYRVLGILRIGSGGVRLRVGRIEFALRVLGRGLLLLVGGLLLVGLVLGLRVYAVGGLTGFDGLVVCVERLAVGFVLGLGGLGGLVGGLLGVLGAFLQCGEFLLRLLRGLLGLVRLVESLLVHVGSRIQRVLVGKKLLTVIVHGNTTGVQILLSEVLCCGQGTRDGEASGVAIRVDDVQIMSGLLVDVRILHVDFHGGHIAQFRILLRIPVEHGLLLGIPAVIRITVTPSEVLGGSGEHVSRVQRVRVVVCGELRVGSVHVVDGPFRQSEATANRIALVNQVERLEHVLQAGRGVLVPNLHPVLVLVFDELVERMLGVLVRIVGSKLPLVEADGTGLELLVRIVGGSFLGVRVGLRGVGGRGLRVRVLLLLADAGLRVFRVLVGCGLRGVGVVLRG